MALSLRRRLLTVAVLATVACGGALFSIYRLVRTSAEQRQDRARDTVLVEAERLRDASELLVPQRPRRSNHPWRMVQGGYLGRGHAGREALPAALSYAGSPLDVARAALIGDEVLVREVAQQNGTLVFAIAALPDGGLAWAAMRVAVNREMQGWRGGVMVLALASLLLVLTSLQALWAYRRDALGLRRFLGALAGNLRAPLDRPAVAELGEVADGIAALAQDLAEAEDSRERLQRALAERERLASLGRVAAGMAHEVRNPLASIKLRVDLAERAPDTPVALRQDLRDISAEVARLDRLITDLLVVSGRRTGPRARTDLAALCQRRVALLAAWSAERSVTLEATGAGEAEVAADAIARAVDNLLRNAVEAAPTGTTVRIEVAATTAGAAQAGVVKVIVSDEGPGVPAERVSELFEPFFTTKPNGTGLGLALSQAIAASHGGDLVYQRAAGRTRFVLSLPPA